MGVQYGPPVAVRGVRVPALGAGWRLARRAPPPALHPRRLHLQTPR